MAKRIAIIQGHPDNLLPHFGHALAAAYEEGARAGGHEIRRLEVAGLDLPPLRSKAAWEAEPDSEAVREAQALWNGRSTW